MNSYEIINEVLKAIAGEAVSFSLTSTDDSTHGEYATNVAFVLSKSQGVSPKVCADGLVSGLQEKLGAVVGKIEVAGPGFINFFLKDDVIRKENEGGLKPIVTKYTGKNILVEHSSPNLFKPFHIGHLMNNIVGMFVTRATEVSGGNVREMSFPSDISLGIAKAVYVLLEDKKRTEDSGEDFYSKMHALDFNKIEYFGEVYRKGVAHFEERPEEIQKAKDIAHIIFGREESEEVWKLYDWAKEENLKYFITIINGLGSHIDPIAGTVFESNAGFRGEVLVKENTGEGKVFTKSEGAVVYIPDESRKDLHTSVFINSEGYPTYEAKDLGLMEFKFTQSFGSEEGKAFSPDFSFFITDAEQISHFKIVLDAASKLPNESRLIQEEVGWKERVERSIHIPHGRMLFKGQKMSSRLGGVPLALDVIAVVEEEVRERAGEKIAHLGQEEKAKLEREIALSALRIAVLRSKPGININFDPETSLSFEGDSGPYLLYTHARCASLLEKGNVITPAWGDMEITVLEKKLLHFERELIASCEDLAPQKLVSYLFSVAQLFNSYYASTQILVEGDDIGNAHRLMIVKRVKEVLNRGLHVLGIEAPEKM